MRAAPLSLRTLKSLSALYVPPLALTLLAIFIEAVPCNASPSFRLPDLPGEALDLCQPAKPKTCDERREECEEDCNELTSGCEQMFEELVGGPCTSFCQYLFILGYNVQGCYNSCHSTSNTLNSLCQDLNDVCMGDCETNFNNCNGGPPPPPPPPPPAQCDPAAL